MSPLQIPLVASASPQEFPVRGTPNGLHELVLAFDTAPSAGTVVIEYSLLGDPTFITLFHANGKSVTSGYLSLRVDGALDRLRVTFTGLVGGVAPTLWVNTIEFPADIVSGVRGAMVVQPYTEVNVKHGLQFYARAAWPLSDTISAGETVKMHFVTGTKVVLVKIRELTYVAEELVLRLFANPVNASAGTPITIKNYNLRNPQATTIVKAAKNVTTTSDGTEIEPADPEYFFGAGAAGNRTQATSPTGFERVIPPNSSLLLTLQNTGSGAARAQYFLTWYEGEPDLPL